MSELTKREQIALQILNGIVSADWKFEIPEGRTWDEISSLRAFDLADTFIGVSEGKVIRHTFDPTKFSKDLPGIVDDKNDIWVKE
jgi:hypothetical protein